MIEAIILGYATNLAFELTSTGAKWLTTDENQNAVNDTYKRAFEGTLKQFSKEDNKLAKEIENLLRSLIKNQEVNNELFRAASSKSELNHRILKDGLDKLDWKPSIDVWSLLPHLVLQLTKAIDERMRDPSNGFSKAVIYNLLSEQRKTSHMDERSDELLIPKPPDMYAVPTPRQYGESFIGRNAELMSLNEWAGSENPIMIVEAIGEFSEKT